MSLLAPGHDFWRDALCREVGIDVFFVGQGGDVNPAKAICARCAVAERCLEWALATESEFDEYGVYGGKSALQRRAIRQAREREAAA